MKRFLNLLRRLFSGSRLVYQVGAVFYHKLRRIFAFISCFFKGVLYFNPIGPSGDYTSQFGQDRVLESLGILSSSKNGFFVEVGCNHPVCNSNSRYLELNYGFQGVAVDPIDYGDLYRLYRPNTEFVNAAIDSSRSSVVLNMAQNISGWEDQVSSLYGHVVAHGRGFDVRQVTVEAVTLASICKKYQHIDILFLDVEGHEINVLKSLDWERIQPIVVVAENNGEFYPRRRLEKFMKKKGYFLLARIGASDDVYKKKW